MQITVLKCSVHTNDDFVIFFLVLVLVIVK